jgi:hypothetical protein
MSGSQQTDQEGPANSEVQVEEDARTETDEEPQDESVEEMEER